MNSRRLRASTCLPSRVAAADLARWKGWLADSPCAFLSPSFAQAVEGARGGVRVCLIYEGSELAAVFPYQFIEGLSGRVGGAERVGGHLSDACGVVARPGFRIAPGALVTLAGIAGFEFSHLPASQLAFGLDGERPEVAHRIELPLGGRQYWADLAARDKKFTSDTDRRVRKLVNEIGPLTLRLHDGSSAALDHLVARKRERYRITGVADALGADWTRRLLAGLAPSAEDDCRGLCSTLHAGDTWVASHFGLLAYGTLHYWFPVYNDDLHRYAPGRQLMRALFDADDQSTVRVIDRGAGDTQAKRDFSKRHIPSV